MLFNDRWLVAVDVEIVTAKPPTLRCQLCGHEWQVQLADGGVIEPVGEWFCPQCRKAERAKLREMMGE